MTRSREAIESVLAQIEDAAVNYTTTPQRIGAFAEFMARAGTISTRPRGCAISSSPPCIRNRGAEVNSGLTALVTARNRVSFARLWSQPWMRKLAVLVALASTWKLYARRLANPLLVPTCSATVGLIGLAVEVGLFRALEDRTVRRWGMHI